MDSLLVVKMVSGEYKVKAKNLVPFHKLALSTLKCCDFETFSIRHIPRNLNAEADKLASLAISQYRDTQPTYGEAQGMQPQGPLESLKNAYDNLSPPQRTDFANYVNGKGLSLPQNPQNPVPSVASASSAVSTLENVTSMLSFPISTSTGIKEDLSSPIIFK
jgi:hypothetical protein